VRRLAQRYFANPEQITVESTGIGLVNLRQARVKNWFISGMICSLTMA